MRASRLALDKLDSPSASSVKSAPTSASLSPALSSPAWRARPVRAADKRARSRARVFRKRCCVVRKRVEQGAAGKEAGSSRWVSANPRGFGPRRPSPPRRFCRAPHAPRAPPQLRRTRRCARRPRARRPACARPALARRGRSLQTSHILSPGRCRSHKPNRGPCPARPRSRRSASRGSGAAARGRPRRRRRRRRLGSRARLGRRCRPAASARRALGSARAADVASGLPQGRLRSSGRGNGCIGRGTSGSQCGGGRARSGAALGSERLGRQRCT